MPRLSTHHGPMPTSPGEEDLVFQYDPEAAENGWNATAANRSAVGPASLPSVDLSDVAVLGLRTARTLLRPEIRRPYEAQLAEVFDPAILDRLEPASWAVWFGDSLRRKLESTTSAGKLSVDTLERSTTVRKRMVRVAEYTLIDHPKAGRQVEAIKAGRGFADLGRDLTDLSGLYRDYRGIVSQGGLHYQATDEALAKTLAAQILFELGESQTEALKKIKLELSQAFALLKHDYNKIRRFAAAFWDDDDYFPSLFTASSSSSSSSSSKKSSEPVKPPAPVTDPDAGDTDASDTDAS